MAREREIAEATVYAAVLAVVMPRNAEAAAVAVANGRGDAYAAARRLAWAEVRAYRAVRDEENGR
jgi:hypothetical protein